MTNFVSLARRVVTSEDAPTMVEYGLIVALIAVVAGVAARLLGGNIASLFNVVTGTL